MPAARRRGNERHSRNPPEDAPSSDEMWGEDRRPIACTRTARELGAEPFTEADQIGVGPGEAEAIVAPLVAVHGQSLGDEYDARARRRDVYQELGVLAEPGDEAKPFTEVT